MLVLNLLIIYFKQGDIRLSLLTVSLKWPVLPFLWMILKPKFQSPNHSNLWYGLNRSTTFFIWAHCKDKLQNFLDDLNSFDNYIKFIHESSKENFIFFDLIVKLSKVRLTTDLHIKDTDRHHYLLFNSSHPDQIKRLLIYNQVLRLTKICTLEMIFYDTEMK